MKSVTETYYCDLCVGEIASYPFSVDSPGLQDDHAMWDDRCEWQTLTNENGTPFVLCGHCSRIIKAALDNKIVSIVPFEREKKMREDAGWRLDDGKWIPVTLYEIKKERGLISDD